MNDRLALGEMSPDVVAIVTDIDNTLAKRDDASETLSSHTRRAFGQWLQARIDDSPVSAALELRSAVESEIGEVSTDTVINHAYQWIREQRQSPALETALGEFWRTGYAENSLDNTLAPDAVAGLEFWAEDRRALFIFSERPRVAQQALISHSDHGDLGELFAGFFDTRMGPPDSPATYHTIAAALGEIPASILFISATLDSLDAAAEAGWQTCFIVRDAETEEVADQQNDHPVVTGFDSIELL